MEVRELQPADLPTLASLTRSAIREGAREHYSGLEIEAWVSSHSQETFIRTRHVLVATRGTQLLGVAGAEPGTPYALRFIAVDPAFWGSGVGTQLVRCLESICTAAGLRELRVAAALNAVPFYTALGYESQRSLELLLPHPTQHDPEAWLPVPALAMARTLARSPHIHH
jgi:putative acetyltransferase